MRELQALIFGTVSSKQSKTRFRNVWLLQVDNIRTKAMAALFAFNQQINKWSYGRTEVLFFAIARHAYHCVWSDAPRPTPAVPASWYKSSSSLHPTEINYIWAAEGRPLLRLQRTSVHDRSHEPNIGVCGIFSRWHRLSSSPFRHSPQQRIEHSPAKPPACLILARAASRPVWSLICGARPDRRCRRWRVVAAWWRPQANETLRLARRLAAGHAWLKSNGMPADRSVFQFTTCGQDTTEHLWPADGRFQWFWRCSKTLINIAYTSSSRPVQ